MEKTFVMQSADDIRNLNWKDREAITEVDASSVYFTQSTNLSGMFNGCIRLNRVVLSDTITYAKVSHVVGGHYEEYSTWGGAHTPSQADFAGTLARKWVEDKRMVPFAEATEAEQRKHLGLGKQTVITIVPHSKQNRPSRTFVMRDPHEIMRDLSGEERLSITEADASGVRFLRSDNLNELFKGCPNLEKVILSDTILNAGRILRVGYTAEELDDIYREEYRARGPELAVMAVERAKKAKGQKRVISFEKATEEERLKYLGLADQEVEIVIVPHKEASVSDHTTHDTKPPLKWPSDEKTLRSAPVSGIPPTSRETARKELTQLLLKLAPFGLLLIGLIALHIWAFL